MALANRKIGYDEVEPRDLHFDVSAVPKYWMNNDPWTTHWWNAILAAVPEGERWVMQAVRRNLSRLDNEEVRKAAIGFIKQEHYHAREGEALNDALRAQGVAIDQVEAGFLKIRGLIEKLFGDGMQLSLVAAFEHFTGTISSLFVDHPELMKGMDPAVASMMAWHMVEETEHKSVSYDVFQDAVGSYPKRVAGLVIATVVFLAMTEYQRLYLVYKDGQLFNWRSALRALSFQYVYPGVMRRLASRYLPYYLPGFHPWDDDNRAKIQSWKRVFRSTQDAAKAYSALLAAA
ncbi:MAG: metal-dependent hydrolase [Pseudomonadota bacterium]